MQRAFRGSLAEVLTAVVGDADDVALVCVDASTLVAVVDVLETVHTDQSVRVLAPAGTVRTVNRDHVAAARLAELAADDKLTLRTVETGALETVVVTESSVVSLLFELTEDVLGVPTTDEDAVASVREAFGARWDAATAHEPDEPTYTALVSSFEAAFDADTAADLEAALEMPGVRGLDENLDLVELLVLIAARHRHQLYELTHWGSEAGVASVGTFSQAKRRLEDIGIVDTETVHSGDVGRPRQRVVIGEEALEDATAEELVEAAQSVLVE